MPLGWAAGPPLRKSKKSGLSKRHFVIEQLWGFGPFWGLEALRPNLGSPGGSQEEPKIYMHISLLNALGGQNYTCTVSF